MAYICNITRGYRCTFTASDDGSDSTASSCVLIDEADGIISTPSGSTISSTKNNAEVQSAGSLTPPAYLSPVVTPSVAGSTDEVPPLIDVEDILTNEFGNLTFHEKQHALAAVGKFAHCDSALSSEFETDTEIWPKTHAAKTCKNRDTSDNGNPHDGIKPSLADWQALCKAVGVAEDEMPSSINKCKKTLKSYNTNLSDLSNALRNGTVAQTFPSVAALARYSKCEGKIISKIVAKKDPLLKAMLRGLFRGGKGKGK